MSPFLLHSTVYSAMMIKRRGFMGKNIQLKAIMTMGISACGKTTWAKQFQKDELAQGRIWSIVCRDDIRAELQGLPNVDWKAWKWKDESKVNKIQTEKFHKAARNGWNIIVADTNLNPKTRQKLNDTLTRLGYEVEIKEFHISLEEAWKRDAARENGVGHSVIADQYYKHWLGHKGRKVYEGTPGKPKAVIVDIDGTLAHGTGRKMYDFQRVKEDAKDALVPIVVKGLQMQGYKTIILSGRGSECRSLTEEWLQENDIHYDDLFMRAKADRRKDTVVKEELFWTHVAEHYDVGGVFDDRPSVCRLWQEMGLKTFIVGNPWVEF